MNIKKLENYIAEDVLDHHLSEYFTDIEIEDSKGEPLYIENNNYYKLLGLYLDPEKKYSANDLDFLIWCQYEDEDDEHLKKLMSDMYESQLSVWTNRLKKLGV